MRCRVFFLSVYASMFSAMHVHGLSQMNLCSFVGILKLSENTEGKQKEQEPKRKDSLTKSPLRT